MPLDADSLERLVPDRVGARDLTGEETLRLHVERYEFAATHARPGRVLDIACGAGYGTRLLADRCAGVREALGVDLSELAVSYARERYGNDRVHFRVADAMDFTDGEGFDTVVSIETVEHLARPDAFATRLAALLRPGGVLVASVPTTFTTDVNPHHLHDFSERSFRRLFASRGLREIDCLRQIQGLRLGPLLRREESRMRDMRANLPAYYLSHPWALLRRVGSTLRTGLANHYITIAWRADD
jgi:SAM-dependent methyltransferase